MDGLGMKRVIRIVIKPSFTATQWGLGDAPERDEVATALNSALRVAVNAGDASPPSVFEAMNASLAQYEDVVTNTADAQQLVERVVRAVHGTT